MPSPANHDVRANVLTIGGVHVPPSGEGSFLAFTFPDDVSAVEANDGQAIRNLLPNRTAELEITCSPYSVAHRRLAALYQQQAGQGSTFQGFVLQYGNGTNGDSVASPSAVFVKRPDTAVGREHADVTWKLHLAEVTRGYGATIPDAGV